MSSLWDELNKKKQELLKGISGGANFVGQSFNQGLGVYGGVAKGAQQNLNKGVDVIRHTDVPNAFARFQPDNPLVKTLYNGALGLSNQGGSVQERLDRLNQLRQTQKIGAKYNNPTLKIMPGANLRQNPIPQATPYEKERIQGAATANKDNLDNMIIALTDPIKNVGGKKIVSKVVGDVSSPNIQMGRKTVSSPNSQSLGKDSLVQIPANKPVVEQPRPQLNTLGQNPKGNQGIVSKSPSSSKIIPQTGQDIKSILTGSQVKDKSLNVRLSNNTKYPQPVQDMLQGTYVVKDNATTIKDAKNLIRLDPKNAEVRALSPKNAVDIHLGSEFFNKYTSQGNFDKAVDFVNASESTNLGQMVQIFSQYDKTTPQGAVRFAQSAINKYNKIHKNSPLVLGTSDIENFVNQAKKIQGMAEGRDRNIASNDLMNAVNQLIPSTFTDKAITVWKAGLLTSPRTTLRNIVGNTVHGVAEIAKDPFAAVNDFALSKRTGQRTLTATVRGEVSGAKKGLQASKDIMTTGYDPTENIAKFDIQKVNWGKSPISQGLKKYTDFVFNSLGAQDKPFYHAALNRSLYDQAGAAAINAGKRGDKTFIENLVKTPTEDMLKNATQDASVATFKNRNALGKLASSFKRGMKGSQLGEAVSEIVAPFTGVPSSIAGQIINYSPIGLGKGIVHDVKVLARKTPELQRQASQEIGRGVIGTGIMGIAAILTTKGLMTGQPKDATEARQWQLEGKQANSVMIGGKWRSINSIGPEALVALAGSKVAMNKPFAETTANIGKDFLSQTFLQGVQGPLNAISDPTRYAQTYVSQQLSSTIPNIVKDTSKAVDNTQRETTANDFPTAIKNAVYSGIPGLRNSLLPKRDALGNPMKQEPTGAWSFVDLFNSKTPINNPLVSELSRLNLVGENATPSTLTKNQTVYGQKLKLTPQELDTLEQQSGGAVTQTLNSIVSDPGYKSLSDNEKKTIVDKAVSDVRTQAKKGAISGSFDPNALVGKYQTELQKDTFAASDKNFSVQGDNIFRKNTDGTVKVTPKIQYEGDLISATLTSNKKSGNIKSWLTNADKLYQNYQTQLQDPSLDELEKLSIQNKVDTLLADAEKYQGYGGFTKPKAAKKAPKVAMPSISSLKRTRPTVRKPTVGVMTGAVKKPSGSSITASSLRKSH